MIRILQSKDQTWKREWSRLLARRTARLSEAEETVRPILDAVRTQGDKGLLAYARRFDQLERKSVRVPPEELAEAASRLTPEFRSAVETAAANVHRFAQKQLPRDYHALFGSGMKLGQIVRPLDTVGCYIPAGRYPLPSTLIMTAVPAQAAGVKNICVACPKPVDEVYGTAHLLGVDQVFQMGGAQAIAAFAFGTKTVPRADRIVGPGNIYVAAAKKLLAGEVGIDFVAGPTEILIIAAAGDAKFLAADMLAQAEHDTDAAALLLTTSKRLAAQVAKEVERQLATLSTAAVARKAIDKNSAIVIVRSLDEAAELSNAYAPEHLSIHGTSASEDELIPKIRHAGSIFLGPYSPEAAGDYAAGPNHVLPTSGAARLRGGLSAADYVKVISIQQLDRRALANLAPAITTLARAEGLKHTPARWRCALPISPRRAVVEMAPYVPPSGGRADKLRLDFNENTVGCSPRVIEFLTSRLCEQQLSIYPEYTRVKPALARFFKVQPDELLLTNGTDEAIQVLVNTYIDDDAEVIILRPSYAMYRFYSDVAGARVKEIDYVPGTLAFPMEQLLDAISPATRAILISNPNNPTGTAIDVPAIRRILDRAPDAAVLIDEAYYEFFGITALPLLAEYPNLFVSRTFSKVYGMAAMRIGCLFSQAANAQYLHKAQSPYSVNTLAALAAEAAVEDTAFVARYVAEALRARELLRAGLEKLGIEQAASSANFILGYFGDRAVEVRDALRDKAILVRDRSYEIPGGVRITAGTREQAQAVLDELEKIW